MPDDWSIEPLGPDDVEALTDLASSRGWGQVPRRRWVLTVGLAEVWGVRGPDGVTLIGAVSLYQPDGGAAVVGAMLVAQDHERQGLGSALLTTVLAALPPGTDAILYATPVGEALYRRAGFVDREVVHVHMGPGHPARRVPARAVGACGWASPIPPRSRCWPHSIWPAGWATARL